MQMFILYTILYFFLVFFDILVILQKKDKKLIVLYSTLIIVAFLSQALIAFGVKLPSPAEPFKNFILNIVGQQ